MKKYIYIILFTCFGLNAISQSEHSDFKSALDSKETVETLILRIEDEETLDERIGQLQNLKELRILSFQGEEINLPTELKNLPKLERLSIYGKDQTIIPKIVFELNNLKDLRIGFGRLKDSDSLSKLKQIESLVLLSDSIEVFPKSVFQLENLKTLVIQGSNIKEIPEGIGKLSKLTHLTFDAVNLCKAPNDLKKLSKLKYIHLRIENNVRIELNSDLKELREFSWYKAPQFPKFICSYPSIERLQLWQGNISEIPDSICNMKKLRDFTVSEHPLISIPSCLSQLENITMLDFRSTDIKSIDESIFSLPKLFNILIEDCENFDQKRYEYLKAKYGTKLIK